MHACMCTHFMCHYDESSLFIVVLRDTSPKSESKIFDGKSLHATFDNDVNN